MSTEVTALQLPPEVEDQTATDGIRPHDAGRCIYTACVLDSTQHIHLP